MMKLIVIGIIIFIGAFVFGLGGECIESFNEWWPTRSPTDKMALICFFVGGLTILIGIFSQEATGSIDL